MNDILLNGLESIRIKVVQAGSSCINFKHTGIEKLKYTTDSPPDVLKAG
jgi:hypothetical protein